jgi:arginine repressor
MGEWVAEVKPSGNLVVLRTPPGLRARRRLRARPLDVSGLIGTVAGDDT